MFAVIGDIYYVHERGTRVAALTIAISGIANLPALLSGLITDQLGWRWNFWMLAIFLGLGLALGGLRAFDIRPLVLDYHAAKVSLQGSKLGNGYIYHEHCGQSTQV